MLNLALLVSTGGVLALLAFLLCASLSPSRRFNVAAFLAIPQFFVPGIPLSVAEVWFAFMAVLALFDRRLLKGVSRPMWTAVLLAGVYMLAQLWSVEPFGRANLLTIFRILLFACLLAYATALAKENPWHLRTAIMSASPWIAFQGLLTTLFVLKPAVENTFLRSQIGQLLAGADAARLFQGQENNVLDPLKAGGLFVNGNVGSMFCGAAFFVVLVGFSMRRSVWLGVVACLSISGAISSGSKTGAALALILPLACIILYWLSFHRARVLIAPLMIALAPFIIWIQNILPEIFPAYVERSAASLGTRGQAWTVAWQLFQDHPVLGLGFQGWEQDAWAAGRIYGLMPHNFVIAGWAAGGVLAAAMIIIFMVSAVFCGLQGLLSANLKQIRAAVTTSLFAMLWVFFHGMADNTTFYGESRTMLLFALAAAMSISASKTLDSAGSSLPGISGINERTAFAAEYESSSAK